MPVPVDEIKKYEGYKELEILISKYLESRKGEALSEDEISEGLQRGISLNVKEGLSLKNIGIIGLNIAQGIILLNTLKDMVKSGKIQSRIYQNQPYYYIE